MGQLLGVGAPLDLTTKLESVLWGVSSRLRLEDRGWCWWGLRCRGKGKSLSFLRTSRECLEPDLSTPTAALSGLHTGRPVWP